MSSRAFFISDLHLGHKKIIEFSAGLRECSSIEAHDAWIVSQWNSVVKKRDVVYVLGDVAFSRGGLLKASGLNGTKKLVLGNHDRFKLEEYEAVGFSIIGGIVSYKEFWLTHAPIHPDQLRKKYNIHGHTHASRIEDDRYINVCVESFYGVPVSIEQIRESIECNANRQVRVVE